MVGVFIVAGLTSIQVCAAPEGGVVRAGSASIESQGNQTRILQSSDRAIIDWRGFGSKSGETIRFEQPAASSATLNRVTGGQVSLLQGQLQANGRIFLVNPHGVIFGKDARINVGGLVASTANIDNQDFMAGRLAFTQPGQPGAVIANAGTITAAEGGLVALVAPEVRNDGVIAARLGRVTLAAGDTFALDLHGDQLISLAVSNAHLGKLVDTAGARISQSGVIHADGGQVVLVTVATGKSILDDVINLSGMIRADTVGQNAGRIVLLGQGGRLSISGEIDARGRDEAERGGSIEILGDHVALAPTSHVDASGLTGGGTIHVGGAFQGQGDTYRARDANVAGGAVLRADAMIHGNGGEVVVWADGHTAYAGNISARGGSLGGNGGRVEVSGKQALAFQGDVDLAAPNGVGGSLLLDPAYFNIGLTEASLLNRILRAGATATLQADIDININAMIDGRGRYVGGGLNLAAGNDININNYIVTNHGTIRLTAGSNINIASGHGVFTGSGSLYATSGNTLTNLGLVSAGLLHLSSTAGNVNIDTIGIDAGIGSVVLDAADDVNINQPVINLKNGSSFVARAGNNINVNARIDASGGRGGGGVTLQATTGHVNINEHVVTNNGAIAVAAGGTIVQAAAGNDNFGAPMTKQLRAGSGNISVSSIGSLSLGSLVTTGSVSIASTGGNVSIDVPIYETVGNATIRAAGSIAINQVVANNTSGGHLNMNAGGNLTVNAKVGPWDRTTGSTINRNTLAGGRIALTAGGNIDINTDIASYKGALGGSGDASINLTSTGGSINLAADKKVMSDQGAIHVSSHDDLKNGDTPLNPNDPVSMGYLTAGPLALISTHGSVNINQTIPDTTGPVSITAGNAINVNQRIYTNNADITMMAGTGGITMSAIPDPEVDAALSTYYLSDIDARSGNIWMEAVGDIHLASIRSTGNATIKSSGGMISGGGLTNIIESRQGFGTPARLDIAGADGIVSFKTGTSKNIHAISTNGSIDGLMVFFPSTLEVIAGQDIKMSGALGNNVGLFAGRDILSSSGWHFPGRVTAKAGRDITIGSFLSSTFTTGPVGMGDPANISIAAASVNLAAGGNPFAGLSSVIAGVSAPVNWTSLGAGNVSANANIWLEGVGGMVATASGDITLPGAVHVSALLGVLEDPLSPAHRQQPLDLSAGGSIAIQQIETTGPVSLVAANGGITVGSTIGAHVDVLVAPYNGLVWNPTDLGVASLNMSAGTNIDMREARATRDNANGISGNIFIAAPNGQVNLAGGAGIQVDAGATRSITDSDGVTVADAIDVTTVSRLGRPFEVAPPISAGPTIVGPGAPDVPGAPPPGAPDAASVAGLAAPAGNGDTLAEIFVPEPAKQVEDQGSGSTEDQGPENPERALSATEGAIINPLNPLAFDTATGAFLVFPGGRGSSFEEERRR